MQFFYEIFPVFLFFIAFKFYGIYVATVVGIVTTLLQVIFTRLYMRIWDKKQLFTLGVFALFGGMTLYFHDPIFVKWKPTIIFWFFALGITISAIFMEKPIMQRMMEGSLPEVSAIPKQAWKRLNFCWALFFAVMGGINLYVAYHFDNDAWVNFKFYGITLALFIFSILQALYLLRFINASSTTK